MPSNFKRAMPLRTGAKLDGQSLYTLQRRGIVLNFYYSTTTRWMEVFFGDGRGHLALQEMEGPGLGSPMIQATHDMTETTPLRTHARANTRTHTLYGI